MAEGRPRVLVVDDERSHLDLLYGAAPPDDTGKVGLPDRILLKTTRSHDEALEAIREGSGGRFDPRGAAACIDGDDDVKGIAVRLADPSAS